jgi:hypothetical protein
MSHLVLTLVDENNPQGVRMILRNYEKVSFDEFVKEAMVRLETKLKPIKVKCLTSNVVIKNCQDLLSGDKLLFTYKSGPQSSRAVNAFINSNGERSLSFEALRLLLTLILFIVMHQTFLWWLNASTLSSSNVEKQRIHDKINQLKYPDGYSGDL